MSYTHFGRRGHITSKQKEENSFQGLEARQKLIPFVPSVASYKMGWKALQAVRYRSTSGSFEYGLPPVSIHRLALFIRPPEKFHLRSEGVKRDRPLLEGMSGFRRSVA